MDIKTESQTGLPKGVNSKQERQEEKHVLDIKGKSLEPDKQVFTVYSTGVTG